MDQAEQGTAKLAALEAHRRRAADAPDDPAAQFRLATFAQALGLELIEESASALRRAAALLEARGERGEPWERAVALLALGHAVAGRREEARAQVERVLAHRAESPSAHGIRAELLFREGNDAEARAALARARAADPDHPVASTVAAARGV